MARGARGDDDAGKAPDGPQARSAGQQHPLGLDRTVARLHARDPGPRGIGPQAGECRPLAQSHPGGLHGQRVRAHVARRVDMAIRRPVAPPAVAFRRQRPGELGGLARTEPADVGEAGRVLHRDPLVSEALVLVGGGEDEVAEFPEPGIRAVGRGLAAIEVDRPAAERDRGGGTALRPDDAGGARRCARPREAAIQDDDPVEPFGRREDRRPASDRARPDDDQVRAVRHQPISFMRVEDSRAGTPRVSRRGSPLRRRRR